MHCAINSSSSRVIHVLALFGAFPQNLSQADVGQASTLRVPRQQRHRRRELQDFFEIILCDLRPPLAVLLVLFPFGRGPFSCRQSLSCMREIFPKSYRDSSVQSKFKVLILGMPESKERQSTDSLDGRGSRDNSSERVCQFILLHSIMLNRCASGLFPELSRCVASFEFQWAMLKSSGPMWHVWIMMRHALKVLYCKGVCDQALMTAGQDSCR